MSMRIAILGVGAIGGVIGGYLARAGRDVTLIDTWPANIERIKADGLTVTALEEEFTVKPAALHLGEVSAARQSFDAVFLAVKSFDTPWMAKFVEPYLAPGGYVVSAQNSINEDAIAAVLGWPRVMGCVVTLGAGMYEPGHGQRTSGADRHALALGEPSGLTTERLKNISSVLGECFVTKTTTNLWGERWAKLATNCMANALAGITGLKSAEIRQNARVRDTSLDIVVELLHVAEAIGVSVEPISGIPAPLFLEASEGGAKRQELDDRLEAHGRTLAEGRPSLAQDVMKGRKTEVEYLNGYVVKKGEELGIDAPVNRAVLELTKRVEAGELEPSLSNLDLLPK